MSGWVKWMAGAAGALVGAAACGIVVIMVWFAIDPPPKYDSWDRATQFDLPQRVELQIERRDVAPMRVSYRPLSDRNGFDLSVSGTKRAYLLDSSGQWHVTGFVQQAREEDPAPAACEMDQSQPCEG